jgi:hypothetical protein
MPGLDNAVKVTANYNTIYNEFASVVAANITGEQIVLTVPIDANQFPAKSYLNITYYQKTNQPGVTANNSGNVQYKIRIGTAGLSSPTLEDFGNNNSATIERRPRVRFISTTAARVNPGWSESNHVPMVVRTVNTALAFNLYFTIEKQSSAADYAEISDILIEAGGL